MNPIRRLWRCRWNFARLAVAASLLWFFAADTGARLAREQLAALGDFDYLAEAKALRAQGRFGEAINIADAGVEATEGPAKQALIDERTACAADATSWLRKAKDVGMGALSGSGDNLESLAGAITADLFIVGDVRDLLIQGSHLVVDGEADPLITALSAVGIATTLAPEIDWVPSLLKIARKSGKMTRGFVESLGLVLKSGKAGEVKSLFGDIAAIARRTSPGGALHILKALEKPEDAAKVARFLERNEKAGYLALHVGKEEAVEILKNAEKSAGKGLEKGLTKGAAEAATDATLIAAARKGPRGMAWLRSGAGARLMRPHLIVGLAKGLYKGNVQAAVTRVLELASPSAWWLIPALAAWTFIEGGLLLRRWTGLGGGPATPRQAGAGRPATA